MISLVSRAALTMGSILLGVSALLLFALTPGTSQFAVTIINMIMGGTMIGVGIVLVLVSRRNQPRRIRE